MQPKRINNDDYGSNDNKKKTYCDTLHKGMEPEKLQLITMLAESVRPAVTPHKPRLYDPETGEYLNDETMQAIEDVRSGKDQGTTYESFEEFKKAMLAL